MPSLFLAWSHFWFWKYTPSLWIMPWNMAKPDIFIKRIIFEFFFLFLWPKPPLCLGKHRYINLNPVSYSELNLQPWGKQAKNISSILTFCCFNIIENELGSQSSNPEQNYLHFHHHYHHHLVAPPARISLTLSRHSSLSFVTSGRSSGLHPVSTQSCCM